ncbi:uncharacterized protein R166.3-like [Hippocampus zosterae]|uniref:uncharacterized protein R166.3-like n=1 Tax=Hippocampus zosterae TaxID=109293 RepID=UPI00223E613E|nr:uncharacterized protein R166.3-like [Hippocampus zosterae]
MATIQHCAFCFKTVYAALVSAERPSFQSENSSPLFVTWTKGPEDDLRGCIGTFQADRLSKLLPQYAMISAFSDSRFKPITLKELPSLSVAVSLLVNFEKRGKKPLDWEVGKHGVIIEFEAKGEQFSGTFLPEVASEQGWDQATTLKHLVRKAGYTGSIEKIMP